MPVFWVKTGNNVSRMGWPPTPLNATEPLFPTFSDLDKTMAYL